MLNLAQMTKVSLNEAKASLSEWVERSLQGEEVIITENGKALVRLIPVEQMQKRPRALPRTKLSDEETEASMNPLSAEKLGATS